MSNCGSCLGAQVLNFVRGVMVSMDHDNRDGAFSKHAQSVPGPDPFCREVSGNHEHIGPGTGVQHTLCRRDVAMKVGAGENSHDLA